MWAMVLDELNKELVYRQYPDPKIVNSDDVIIRVKTCGVCATDLKVISGHIDSKGLPRILGHEPMGEIVAMGSAVTSVNIGDRVISSTYMTCKECKYCRSGRETLCINVKNRLGIDFDGGFSEYMKIKVQNIVKVPDGVDDAEAALLPCGAGVPFHALVKRISLSSTDKIIILGVGGVGIQTVQIAKLFDAQIIAIDVDDEKLTLAKKHGASFTINTKKADYLDQIHKIKGATVLFDTVGNSKLISECVSVLERGAKIVLVAYGPGKDFQIPMETVVLNELEIYGSRGVSIKDVEDLMLLVQSETIRPIVERYPLSELNNVINKMKINALVGRAVIIP